MNRTRSRSSSPACPLTAAALLLAAGLCGPGQAQQNLLFRHRLTTPPPGYGQEVAGLGDIDGDGFGDYAVEATNHVYVYSGRDGKEIKNFPMMGVDAVYPAMAAAGDVDADGKPDLLVGDWDGGASRQGIAWVVSGAWITGARVPQFVHTLQGLGSGFGQKVRSMGDVNRDGHEDFGAANFSEWIVFDGKTAAALWRVPGAWLAPLRGDVNKDGTDDMIGAQGSAAFVLSGVNGLVIRSMSAPRTYSADSVGDVNGDGVPDFVISSTNYDFHIRSGKDMSSIHYVATLGQGFARRVYGVGDLDGDGVPDVVATHTFGVGGPPRAFSGKSGALIGDFGFPTTSRWWAFAPAGDVDGDGLADVIAGIYSGREAAVYSGVPRRLAADVHEVPIAAGGAQTFELGAGAGFAGATYLLVGSASGIEPGLVLGPTLTLPLNLDAYLQFTADARNLWIQGALGQLDGAGRARARLALPPNLPTRPIRLDHAYVVLSSRGFEMVSNPVPLSLY